jgi:carbamoyl-phosphate synthase large subunit
MHKQKVMIAGVGGASLGTEICKALLLAGRYEVYGCDISSTAYGMHDPAFTATYKVDQDQYLDSVLHACECAGVRILLPGGEQPMVLLGEGREKLSEAGITLVGNSKDVVSICSNKAATFDYLQQLGIRIPKTTVLHNAADLHEIGLPCIVKPSTGTGGSVSVFFATTVEEAMMYAEFIRRNSGKPIAQEYIDIIEGEFTIGVLSYPDRSIASSIAMHRSLDAKLSLSYRGKGGVISSGYSQGYIDEFQDLCRQAEVIALALGSIGPLNIQGRVCGGVLLPFEINPRFSASTYLRALAGVNEVDIYLQYLENGIKPEKFCIQPGWYLRSLTEQFIPKGSLQ